MLILRSVKERPRTSEIRTQHWELATWAATGPRIKRQPRRPAHRFIRHHVVPGRDQRRVSGSVCADSEAALLHPARMAGRCQRGRRLFCRRRYGLLWGKRMPYFFTSVEVGSSPQLPA